MQNGTQRDTKTPPRQTSIEKAIDILFCFDATHAQLRLTDISNQLSLNPSTTHRLLAVLKKKGLVVADPKTQLYSLGPGIAELHFAAAGPAHRVSSVFGSFAANDQRNGQSL